MHTVQQSQLQKADRYPYFSYTAEASELGLAPGQWPDRLCVAGLGNGNPFLASRPVVADSGEFGGVVYCQVFGCLDITVFND